MSPLRSDPLAARLLANGQPEDDVAAIVERAAILEYDAGLPRAEAESQAIVAERRRRAERALL